MALAGTHSGTTRLVTTSGVQIPVSHSRAEAAAKCDTHAIATVPGAKMTYVFFDDTNGNLVPVDVQAVGSFQ